MSIVPWIGPGGSGRIVCPSASSTSRKRVAGRSVFAHGTRSRIATAITGCVTGKVAEKRVSHPPPWM